MLHIYRCSPYLVESYNNGFNYTKKTTFAKQFRLLVNRNTDLSPYLSECIVTRWFPRRLENRHSLINVSILALKISRQKEVELFTNCQVWQNFNCYIYKIILARFIEQSCREYLLLEFFKGKSIANFAWRMFGK